MQAPPAPQQKSPVLKIACFGCIGLILLGILGCCGITGFTMSMLKSSHAYTQGLAKATSNAEVKAGLGEPIEAGFFVAGNYQETGSTGFADLVIPIKGPKGDGILTVNAAKVDGAWVVRKAIVVLPATNTSVDLMLDEEEPDESPSESPDEGN